MPDYINLKNARIIWYGEELLKEMRKEAIKRFKLILEFLKVKIQRNISEPQPPSQPGDFPHADTGKLRQSIFWTFDEGSMSGIVGTPLDYGVVLEYGFDPQGLIIYPKSKKALHWIDRDTGEDRFAKSVVMGKIEQRSFLRRTLVESEAKIQAIWTAPIPGGGYLGGVKIAA